MSYVGEPPSPGGSYLRQWDEELVSYSHQSQAVCFGDTGQPLRVSRLAAAFQALPWCTVYFSSTRKNHMDSISKNEEKAAVDFAHDRRMLKDNTIVKVDKEEPEKAKVKTMEAASMSKDG